MHQSQSPERILGWTALWQLKGPATPQCYRCGTVCKGRGQGSCSEKKAAICSEPTQLSLAESGSVIIVYATISPPTLNKHTHKCNSNAEVRQDDHCPSGLCCIHDHMTWAATVKKKGGRGHCTWSNCFFHCCLAKKHIRINYVRSPLKPANPLVCHKLPCKSSFILRSLCPH